jgi:hypothetical protein
VQRNIADILNAEPTGFRQADDGAAAAGRFARNGGSETDALTLHGI